MCARCTSGGGEPLGGVGALSWRICACWSSRCVWWMQCGVARRGCTRLHWMGLAMAQHSMAHSRAQHSAVMHCSIPRKSRRAAARHRRASASKSVLARGWRGGPSPLGSPSPRPLMPVDARQGASARRSVNVALASTSVSVSVSSNMSVSSNVSGSWIASEMVGCLGAQQSPRCPWLCLAQATPAGSVCAWARVCGD